MNKKDKVYCSPCTFFDNEYCDTRPIDSEREYFAPGGKVSVREMCALRNQKNDCSDFKKR